MVLHFFPRQPRFWWYHLGASAACGALTLLTIALWSPLVAQDSAAALVWLLPYTVAVLAFRWLYKKRAWQQQPMSRLIPLVFAYGSVAAVLVSSFVNAATLPFFWARLAAYYAASGAPLDPGGYLVRAIISASLQTQVFICAWIFIYISFTGSRDARRRELDNARLEAALKDAQLRSLSNQLNPHFLFNSLNNIRFVIHENAQRADAMLVSLSEMLRYSLEGCLRDKVRLGEEIAVVEQYIGIAGLQLEERLRFALDVPAQLHGCLVPPLLLQMLVENAVKHGIERLRGGGQVALSASAQDARLRFVVTNDKTDSGNAGTGRDGLGIGIRNIEQRLALLYGAHASHQVRDAGQRYEVVLTIPLELAQ
jgi:hypothetical protein